MKNDFYPKSDFDKIRDIFGLIISIPFSLFILIFILYSRCKSRLEFSIIFELENEFRTYMLLFMFFCLFSMPIRDLFAFLCWKMGFTETFREIVISSSISYEFKGPPAHWAIKWLLFYPIFFSASILSIYSINIHCN